MLQPDNSKNNIANITEFFLCSNELIRAYLVECLVHGKISVHIRAVDDDALIKIMTTLRNNPVTTDKHLLMCYVSAPDASLYMCGKLLKDHRFLRVKYAWHLAM